MRVILTARVVFPVTLTLSEMSTPAAKRLLLPAAQTTSPGRRLSGLFLPVR